MKIILLYPKWTSEYDIFGYFAKKTSIWPPLNLAYLAAIAESMGHNVKIIDGEVENISLEKMIDQTESFKPDIIGITATTPFYHIASNLAKGLKNRIGKIPIVIGGPHITILRDEVFYPHFDYAFIGEADKSWSLFLKKYENGEDISSVKGILFRDEQGNIKFTGDADPIFDIDSIPFPARHLLKTDKYKVGTSQGTKNFTTIMTMRGCPFKCIYCLPKGTLVLTEELTYVPIENIRVGDILIGLKNDDGKFLKFERTTVLNTFKRKDKIYKIRTMNGDVYSTSEHPWLSDHNRWRKTKDFVSGQFLRKISIPIGLPKDTKEYKIGYIAGSYDGDGCISHDIDVLRDPWKTRAPTIDKAYIAKLVGDYDMMDTVLRYSQELCIGLYEASFNGGYWALDSCVVSYKKSIVEYIDKIRLGINLEDNDEYKRGYLAGIYDAEGSWVRNSEEEGKTVVGRNALRIFNQNERILNRVSEYLHHFGFNTILDCDKNGKSCIRILDGLSKILLFFTLVNPKAENKKQQIFDYHLKSKGGYVQILDISPGDVCDVYNLETTTSNFIADGFVTHNCSTKVFGKKIRKRSPRLVIDEIKSVINDYGVKHFIFLDDTLTLDRNHILDICNLIEQENLNITFEGSTRANLIDEELISRMKKAGLIRISFGLESIDKNIRKIMKKDDILIENYIDANRLANKYNIETANSCMIGLPGETVDTIKKTLSFLRNFRDIQIASISIAIPYPGTELYDMAKRREYGLKLMTNDFSKFRRYNAAVMAVGDLSPDDLIKLQNDAYASIYLAPWRLIPMFKKSGISGCILTFSRIIKSIIRRRFDLLMIDKNYWKN